MDNLNWLMIEMMTEQTMRERRLASRPVPPDPDPQRGGIKRALASALVRLGLRLDPAAGEGLRAGPLPLGRPEAGQSA